MLLPGIPLWFVWEDYLRWAGGYGEIAVGVVTIAQISLLVGLRDRLTERMVKLAIRLDHWRRGKTLSGTPTGLSLRTGHRTIASPPERVSSGVAPSGIATVRRSMTFAASSTVAAPFAESSAAKLTVETIGDSPQIPDNIETPIAATDARQHTLAQ